MRALLMTAALMMVMSGSVVSQAQEVPLVYQIGETARCAEVLDKGKIIATDGNATALGRPDGVRTYIWYDGLIWDIYFPSGGEKSAFYCNPFKPILNKTD
jgi:hypothetical protein